MKKDLAVFEGHNIRRVYDEKTETWWFSVVDIIQVLTQQPSYKAAQNYWKVLKHRLNKEGSELVTKCNQLKKIIYPRPPPPKRSHERSRDQGRAH
jgi:DNA-damage-inducible protein D